MPELNAPLEPPVPSSEPVTAIQETQAGPSEDGKQEAVDLSALGDDFKGISTSPKTLGAFKKYLESQGDPDTLEMLATDPNTGKLFFTNESGYRKAHSERFQAHSTRMTELTAKERTLADRERELTELETELRNIDGDMLFHRDPKVRDARKYADEQVKSERWTQDEADKFVKPYLDVAKRDFEARKKADAEKTELIMKQNSEIGAKTFPELDPSLAACIVDGLLIHGNDPQSAADLFRKEFDRVIEVERAKAVAEYVKKVAKQPDSPAAQPEKPKPSAAIGSAAAQELAEAQALFGRFGR